MITSYERGWTLNRYREALGRDLTGDEAKIIVLALLDGLKQIHASGYLHRDLKPENIYITEEMRPLLLDFGSARQIVGNRSRPMTAILTPGYAPLEQYHEDGNQGAWTDLYALAGCAHYMLIGKAPPEATKRERNDPYEPLEKLLLWKYDEKLLVAIDGALATQEELRPQSAEEFRDWVEGRGKPRPTVATISVNEQQKHETQQIILPPPLPDSKPAPVKESAVIEKELPFFQKLLRPWPSFGIASFICAINSFIIIPNFIHKDLSFIIGYTSGQILGIIAISLVIASIIAGLIALILKKRFYPLLNKSYSIIIIIVSIIFCGLFIYQRHMRIDKKTQTAIVNDIKLMSQSITDKDGLPQKTDLQFQVNEKPLTDDEKMKSITRNFFNDIIQHQNSYLEQLDRDGVDRLLDPVRVSKDSDFSESYRILKQIRTTTQKFEKNHFEFMNGFPKRFEKYTFSSPNKIDIIIRDYQKK